MACCAMSGTHIAYGSIILWPEIKYKKPHSWYKLHRECVFLCLISHCMRCPVLTYDERANCPTDIAYGATVLCNQSQLLTYSTFQHPVLTYSTIHHPVLSNIQY
eukprot:3941416-Rhodomonas_salina.2